MYNDYFLIILTKKKKFEYLKNFLKPFFHLKICTTTTTKMCCCYNVHNTFVSTAYFLKGTHNNIKTYRRQNKTPKPVLL